MAFMPFLETFSKGLQFHQIKVGKRNRVAEIYFLIIGLARYMFEMNNAYI